MIITIGPHSKHKAIIDDEDIDLINQYIGWKYDKHTGYAKKSKYIGKLKNGKEKYEVILMHRLIMNCPKNMVVDHINRNKLDNRKANLRICTQSENCFNSKISKNNSSGYVGVQKQKCGNGFKWMARIMKDKKMIYLGLFDKIEDAIEARKKGEQIYFNRFTRTI